MDNTDQRLVAALRRNARASLSDLAADLGLSRATIRTRLEKLVTSGQIVGFTVLLQEDVAAHPVRGLMMLGIEGRGTERVLARLLGMAAVQTIHSTNGKWDLIVEIGTSTLEALDKILADIRRVDGISTSETSLLLNTRRPAQLR